MLVAANIIMSNQTGRRNVEFNNHVLCTVVSIASSLFVSFRWWSYASVALARVTRQFSIAPLCRINEKLRAVNARHVTSICRVSDPLPSIHRYLYLFCYIHIVPFLFPRFHATVHEIHVRSKGARGYRARAVTFRIRVAARLNVVKFRVCWPCHFRKIQPPSDPALAVAHINFANGTDRREGVESCRARSGLKFCDRSQLESMETVCQMFSLLRDAWPYRKITFREINLRRSHWWLE